MKKTAYSLVELSIVILIISILVSGGLSIPTKTAYNRKIATTKERILLIEQALKLFLVTNNRLPCPASPIISKITGSTYGDEGTTAGSCTTAGGYASTSHSNIIYGMVPIRALGLSNEVAEDGFGGKFAYIIDKNFTNSSTFATATAINNITIQNRAGGTLQTITDDAIFTVISYGANQSGAYRSKSSALTMQNARSSDVDELENDLDGTDSGNFDNVIIAKSFDSDIFDDVILYKTRDQIVKESQELSLIKCPALSTITTDISYGGTTIAWPDGNYNQIVVATTACPAGYQATVAYATRRCGAFGIWDDVIHQCILEP